MNSNNLRILILGGTGFVGGEVGRLAASLGHRVTILTRRPGEVRGRLPFPCRILPWDDVKSDLPQEAISECDAVINLIGAGIADKAWTPRRRAEILYSRVESVAALARAIAAVPSKPRVVVQASAIGYYGDRGEEELSEGADAGSGFLAETCVAWERAGKVLETLDVRLVTLRLGLVLGHTGGALPKLLSVYAKGLGAALGSGRQWMSWIHVEDLAAMTLAAIQDPAWKGPFNATAPEPSRNTDFNTALARHGRFSADKRVPGLAVKAAMGRRSSLVLVSARALPAKAGSHGFRFRYETIERAFAALLGESVSHSMRHLVTRQWIGLPAERIWPFFASAQNLERLTPPWLDFRVRRASTPQIERGTTINYTLRLHGLPMGWESEICGWEPGRMFVDHQRRGPYAIWHHTHSFEPMGGGTLMTDWVQYRLPLSPIGELLAGFLVERDVERIFDYRGRMVAQMEAQDFEHG